MFYLNNQSRKMERTTWPEKKSEPKFRKTPGQKSGSHKAMKLAFQFALLGATNKQIAENLDIDLNTLNHWISTNPDFKYALMRGKMPADAKVAKALYRSAIGYSHPETTVLTNQVKEYDADGKVIRSYNEPLLVTTMRHYAPNAFAAFKWLTIRQRAMGWSDNQTVNLIQDITVQHQIDLSDMSTEELLMLEKIGMKKLNSNLATKQQLDHVGKS